MKFKVISIGLTILFIVIYTLNYSSESWLINKLPEAVVYEKDLPYLNSTDRIMKTLSEVQYAAIVYPEKYKVYPNSIFHKYILKNPKESTLYTVKAKVLHTIIGEPMNSIIYGSASSSVGDNAIFVGLCKTDNGFYAPGNGYEFPATQEAIEFIKKLTKESIKKSKHQACPN